jgi:hypothetical protein
VGLDHGVEGNARLTGAVGALLVVLLFVEGITILRVRQLISVHIFVGLLLVPPVLLKMSTTTYRFYRYYTGRPAYVHRGAPNIVLRVAGPLVIGLTLLVFGTGIGLLAVPPDHPGLLLAAHKASFVLWFVVTAMHVLAHLRESVTLTLRELRPAPSAGFVRGRRTRFIATVATVLVGVALAVAVMPSASAWTGGRLHEIHHQDR